MKVTPLEIRQAIFQKRFRGYDKEEVKAFLFALSQEWEKVVDENKDLAYKLDSTEKEVKKLREVESSLYKALKTAEETSAHVIDQANKEADLHVREAEFKAKQLIEEAERKAEKILQEMKDKLKEIEINYKTIEHYRDDQLLDLKNLAEGILHKIEKLTVSQPQSVIS